jgi:hypothetical protein
MRTKAMLLKIVKSQFCGRNRRHAQLRAGLTVLEFAGCVIAVVGGAWLGAIYLGVDVRHVAHTALQESDLLEKVPAEWRPISPEEASVTRQQLVATLREELGSLRTEISALRSNQEGGETSETNGEVSDRAHSGASESDTKNKTLAYWNRINDIALGEAALQHDADTAFDEANAAKVFAIKGRISLFAAKAADALPNADVDASVVQFGRKLGVWYNHAGDLYERAVQIWESPTGKEGRAQLNEGWNRAELQHRNEAQLINELAEGVRSGVSRRFHEEFPKFAKSAETTPNSLEQQIAD